MLCISLGAVVRSSLADGVGETDVDFDTVGIDDRWLSILYNVDI